MYVEFFACCVCLFGCALFVSLVLFAFASDDLDGA
jgi:hypothetical protein